MTGVAYIVRCQHCGVARKSFNDPRRGISVIECKRPCGNSHYNWTYIQTIAEDEVWPQEKVTDSTIPVYVPPVHPPRVASFAPPKLESSPPRDSCKLLPQSKRKQKKFSSEGYGSMDRSPSAAVGDGASKGWKDPRSGATTPQPTSKKGYHDHAQCSLQ